MWGQPSADQLDAGLYTHVQQQIPQAVAAGRITPQQAQEFLTQWHDLMVHGERHTGTKQNLMLFAATALGGLTASALAGGGAAAGGGLPTIGGAGAPVTSASTALSSTPFSLSSAGAGGWLGTAAKVGAPIAAGLISRTGTPDRPHTQTGLPQEIEDQLMQLLQSQQRHLQQQEPVHQAAMQLAMKMAPGSAVGGQRLQDAAQAAMTPRPTQGTDPQVAEAIARLMGRQ